ncbi:YgjP-like metallopeptidase domain-containing protein [Methanotorris igneus]|uniref:YgjP-like metallopeptidase domain-containing protein n=1 Tax=Methanotorris igneus TaxID=2189 RepID=UPI00247A912B|nr:YgjP-like metallopeptidase domain-containing protein [Methanotorris igneus]
MKTRPYKRKIASISYTTKTIYINKNLINDFNEDEIKYIIAHELLHLKFGKFHTLKFNNALYEPFPNKEEIDKRILNKIKDIRI